MKLFVMNTANQVHVQLTQSPGLGTELLVHDVLIDVEKKKRDRSI